MKEIVKNNEIHLANAHKEERDTLLKDMQKAKEKWTRAGGPLREKDFDDFLKMGYKGYIKNLQ